jgi:alpha-tubulin suppressor-like RCC1 family protein
MTLHKRPAVYKISSIEEAHVQDAEGNIWIWGTESKWRLERMTSQVSSHICTTTNNNNKLIG